MNQPIIQIKTLKANSVRGLPRHWEALPFAELGLIIYGSNGSGKSSVVDAAEYALTNESSLFDRNRSGVNWSLAAPHIRHGNPDILLEITDGKTDYAIRPNQDISAFPDDIQSWLSSLDTEIASANTTKNIVGQKIRNVFCLEPPVPISLEELLQILNAKLLEASIPKCSGPSNYDNLLATISAELGEKDVTERLEKFGDLKGQIQRLALPQNLAPIMQELIKAQSNLDDKFAKAKRLVLGDFLV